MKRLIFSVCMLFALLQTAQSATVFQPNSLTQNYFFKTLHFAGTVTLSGGCVVTYDLTLEISIFPLGFKKLTGTLSLSGPCSGTQTITVTGRSDVEEASLNNEAELSGFEIIETVFSNTITQNELNKALEDIMNASHPFAP